MRRTVSAMRGGRRVRSVLVLAALAMVVLGGCASQKAGAAAVVGEQRLTESQLAEWSDELAGVYADNPDAQQPPEDQLSLVLMSWWLNEQITRALAEQEGVTASASEIDQLLGTDPKQREAASAQNAIPPSTLEAAAEYVILRRSLGEALADPGASPEDADAAYLAALRSTAEDLGVSVSPRFGVWNPEIPGLEPRALERLSRPAVTEPTEQAPSPAPTGQ